jgi:hypothetical protein
MKATSKDPLDLREVFSRPWEGEATISKPWWLRWFPVPSRFRFRTEVANVTPAGWDIHDTTSFPGGATTRRTMRCEPIGRGRLRLSAGDMPGGAEITVTPDGFRFTPYTIATPVLGRIRVPLRYLDEVRLETETSLLDTIEIHFLGVRVATITMRLHRLDASD